MSIPQQGCAQDCAHCAHPCDRQSQASWWVWAVVAAGCLLGGRLLNSLLNLLLKGG